MAEQASGQSTFPLSGTPSGLPRGKACLTCRVRKVKCDGTRPICRSCQMTGRAEDCEYAEGDLRSSTHALEEKLRGLRSRIRQLEGRKRPGPAVSTRFSPSSGDLPSPTASGSPEADSSNMDTSNIMLGIPADVIERLVNEFFDREQATWFLQTASFRATISGRSYQDHTSVTSAICMVATMYAPELRIYEGAFRARAYSGLGQTLASGQVLHVLQAHVLLGAHAFARGDFLIARSHASDASLLAYRSSLNLIRSAPSSHVSSVNMLDPVSLSLLPDPQNQLEEGEKINAFWTVTIIDCLWGVALNDLPCLNGQRAGTDVLTPWPLDMWQYENLQDWIQTTQRDDDWLRSFLFVHPASDWATEPSGHLAVTAKAATLLECAARHCRDDAEFVANLDYWVDTLTTGLGPTAVAEPATYSAHLILRAVTFIAHYQCIPPDRSVNAAIALAVTCRVLHPTTSISQFGFLEPAIGIAIPAACRVLISARAIRRAGQGLSSEEVDGAIQSLVELLEAWANVSTFAGIQLERIMQERAAL